MVPIAKLAPSLTAILLLSAPVETPVAPETFALAPWIHCQAIRQDLLDWRESALYLTSAASFELDLKTLRQRWHELHAAPQLSEGARFPDREFCLEQLGFSLSCRSYLSDRYDGEWQNRPMLEQEIIELRRRAEIWSHCAEAGDSQQFVADRRRHLVRLRALLTDQEWHSGCLPACVPIKYFQRIDF